jgi:peptidoglycan hydrolase-like protein with peptidoglycan-binding domain
MMLQSTLFRGDEKLEACAIRDAAHLTRGAVGPHVAKVQKALNILDNASLVEDGSYGADTARAVLRYKQKRGIINRTYQSQADDIVGKMTIVKMDEELRARPDPVVTIGTPGVVRIRPVRVLSLAQRTGNGSPSVLTGTMLQSVVRGNPYVPSGASAGLPPSLPPHKTYAVLVTVNPPLSGSDFIDLAIQGNSLNNGQASVSPSRIQRSTVVTVTGVSQAQPGHAGQLTIVAGHNGAIKATSDGFSVCAHPKSLKIEFARDVFDQTGAGMIVKVIVESDSGVFEDLDKVETSELVEQFQKTEPPFHQGSGFINNSGFTPVLGPIDPSDGKRLSMADQHVEPRPRPGPPGIAEKIQAFMFRCLRCTAQDVPVPNSGYTIKHEVVPSGRGFIHRVEKKGDAIGIKAQSGVSIRTQAGLGRARSPDHKL